MSSMKHFFVEGKHQDCPTILLLHGTGGNEYDLLPIAEQVAPEANYLGLRGNVQENGLNRFFRRHSEGVFDLEDLVQRTEELHTLLSDLAQEYSFSRDRVIALGYSNGANIAASLIYHHEHSLAGAMLFHAMTPREDWRLPPLKQLPVFIAAGRNDPLIPSALTEQLINDLRQAGAEVSESWSDGGHQLTWNEVEKAKAWYVAQAFSDTSD